jgi:hypothetical protein
LGPVAACCAIVNVAPMSVTATVSIPIAVILVCMFILSALPNSYRHPEGTDSSLL